jgi:hypothetical protein
MLGDLINNGNFEIKDFIIEFLEDFGIKQCQILMASPQSGQGMEEQNMSEGSEKKEMVCRLRPKVICGVNSFAQPNMDNI